ncbi:hypothetical protein [Winogradskyella jejuensis]|uniref:Uncharacterized protein n=1 Tax=Winogradskyella jejuensis TaxID=1089305 RepID=A0A1M5LZA1_9FLAO|nr:hypothetical protein [Winogradskyella jejuensis]SHG70316.1 hypothetical protein SAMN05444148_0759 [Winogradskyella jejuensis]
MKIKIKPEAIDINQLKKLLEKHFSGTYTLNKRNKNLLAVAATKTIGATVLVQKKVIIVNGNFPTMGRQVIFTILLFSLGIIPPLLVYFLFYHKKMKAVEKDVVEFITSKYTDQLKTN